MICVGCVEGNLAKKQNGTCPFCRELRPSSDREYNCQLEARALKNDHTALTNLGLCFMQGSHGMPKDDLKALDYWIRAVELGSPRACTFIGDGYSKGNGLAVDKERARFIERVGALRGEILVRHNIGHSEYFDLVNHEIAIRHWKIAAEAGHQPSINVLKDIYNADGKTPGKEFITKDYLESVYRAYHGPRWRSRARRGRNMEETIRFNLRKLWVK